MASRLPDARDPGKSRTGETTTSAGAAVGTGGAAFVALITIISAANDQLAGLELIVAAAIGSIAAIAAYLLWTNGRHRLAVAASVGVAMSVVVPAAADEDSSAREQSANSPTTADMLISSTTSTSSTTTVPPFSEEEITLSDAPSSGRQSADVLGSEFTIVLGGVDFDDHPVSGDLTHLVTATVIDNFESRSLVEFQRAPRGTQFSFGTSCQFEVLLTHSDTFSATFRFRRLEPPRGAPPDCEAPA